MQKSLIEIQGNDAKLAVSRSCFECGYTYKTYDHENKYHLCPSCEDRIDNEDTEDFYERQMEQKQEELAIRALSCKCGAWQLTKDNSVIHIADCCCGAE